MVIEGTVFHYTFDGEAQEILHRERLFLDCVNRTIYMDRSDTVKRVIPGVVDRQDVVEICKGVN